jgi:hypothetical protein
MKKSISQSKLKKVMELQNLLRQEAIKKYNKLDKETQLRLQKQYDFAKYDSKIQKMGGAFEDFLRWMFDLRIYIRYKNGQIEYEVKPENKHKIIKQKLQNVSNSIKRIKNDYSISMCKYYNGDISSNEFGYRYQSCKKSLSRIQRELNKLQKLSKSSKTCFS